ncbi:MAG TPA: RNA methyltransferase [Gaiellaceae bacterium]|nr:RNA methyltransferase [Gaiellaceae bacterium]
MIRSASNPRLKLIRRLRSAAQRRRLGLFVVEGEDLVQAGVDARLEPEDVLTAGVDVDPKLLADVSELAHPPRVIGVFRRSDLPEAKRDNLRRGLALWHVADPGNVGTLVRAADAFGAFVALSPGCGDPTSTKALRASAGAVFRVPLLDFDDAPGPWIALVAHGGAALASVELPERVTFVLGAEREGVPLEVLERCDATATIPMTGSAESLNVGAAGAIALYEHSRRKSNA